MSSPTKIGEYLAAGLHIVGLEGIEVLDRLSKETDCVDILPRDSRNIKYNLNSIKKIVEKIKKVERVQNSIEIAKKYYSLKKALNKYLELYNKILI